MRFFRDLQKYFHYLLFASKSQLRAEVSNSYLNWVWWVLEPFCNMLVYTIIFGYVFNAKEPYFPIFIFVGISIWSFFSKTLNESVKLLKHNKGIITKVYIPKQMLLIKVILVNAFKMCLAFIIIFFMMVLFQVHVSCTILLFVPTVIVLLLFTYGISCFFVHFGVYIEDLSYVTSILLKMLMYFTGIFYSIEKRISDPFGYVLNRYNPIACLITIMRNALLYQSNAVSSFLLLWFIISLFLAIIGTRLIYKNENSYVKVI